MRNPLKDYAHQSLLQVAEKLHVDYYSVLNAIVKAAGDKLAELKQIDVQRYTAQYTQACEAVLCCIQQYLHDRKDVLIPYVKELHQKDAGGHNCSSCSGSCDMGHLSHFAALRESHKKLTEMLHDLQMSTIPLYSNIGFPAVYVTLRCEMQLLDAIVRELIYMEEAHLMPGIVKSQKKINAHN